MAEKECETSRECTVDVDGRTVYRLCYQSMLKTNKTDFCDCSYWFGFTGPTCSDVSPQVVYMRIMSILFTLSSAVVLGWITVRLLYFLKGKRLMTYLEYQSGPKDKSKQATRRAIFIAGCCIMGTLLIFFYGVVTTIAMFNPETDFGLAKRREAFEGEFYDVQPHPVRFAEESVVLAFSFFLMSSLEISISWIELTETVPSFVSGFPERGKWFLNIFKRTSQNLALLYYLVAAILFSVKALLAMAILSGVIAIVLFVLFAIGRTTLINTLKNMPIKSSQSTTKAMRMVKISSLGHVIGLLFIIAALLFHGFFPLIVVKDWPVGEVSPEVISRDVVVVIGNVLLGLDAWYVNLVFDGLKFSSTGSKDSQSRNFSNFKASQSRDHLEMEAKL